MYVCMKSEIRTNLLNRKYVHRYSNQFTKYYTVQFGIFSNAFVNPTCRGDHLMVPYGPLAGDHPRKYLVFINMSDSRTCALHTLPIGDRDKKKDF